MSEKTTFRLVLAFIVGIGILLFVLPVKASEPMFLNFKFCQGTTCQEHAIEVPEGTPMMECIKGGQTYAVKWLVENKPPGWALLKWRCGKREYSL